MTTLERTYNTDDKTTWGDGPWQNEPDKAQWVDEATGYDCLIVRNRGGALCGYVGVPPEHPCHGADYDAVRVKADDDESGYPDVHGGLTYADACQEDADEATGICHIPGDGRPDNVWWFGFDCMHAWDVAPAHRARDGYPSFADESYKGIGYVKREIARLAAQLVTASVIDAAQEDGSHE